MQPGCLGHHVRRPGVPVTSRFGALPAAVDPSEIELSLGALPDVPSGPAGGGTSSHVVGEDVYLHWRGVGSFLVREGRLVTVDPAPGADQDTLRCYVGGPVLAVLLHQRGRLVLHASGVALDGCAVAFLGGSGWGKSTLAGLLHRRGHRFLTDDVLAVDVEHGRAVAPGLPELKLWPDTATALGHDPDAMPRLHPREQKRARRLKRGFGHRPVPLDRLYVLAEGEGPAIEPLSPREALVELLRHSYGARTLQAIRTAEHFRQCARVAAEMPVARLRFPRSFALLDRVARMIEEDCGHAP